MVDILEPLKKDTQIIQQTYENCKLTATDRIVILTSWLVILLVSLAIDIYIIYIILSVI